MTDTFAFQVVYIVHPQFTKQLKLQQQQQQKNTNYKNLIPRYRHFTEHMIFIQLVTKFYTFENLKDFLYKSGYWASSN